MVLNVVFFTFAFTIIPQLIECQSNQTTTQLIGFGLTPEELEYFVNGALVSSQAYLESINGSEPCDNSNCTAIFTQNIQLAQQQNNFPPQPYNTFPPFSNCSFIYPTYNPANGYFMTLNGSYCKWSEKAYQLAQPGSGQPNITVTRFFVKMLLNIEGFSISCSLNGGFSLQNKMKSWPGGILSIQCAMSKLNYTWNPELTDVLQKCLNLNVAKSALSTGSLQVVFPFSQRLVTYSYQGNFEDVLVEDWTIPNIASLERIYNCTGDASALCKCITDSQVYRNQQNLYMSSALPCLMTNGSATPKYYLC